MLLTAGCEPPPIPFSPEATAYTAVEARTAGMAFNNAPDVLPVNVEAQYFGIATGDITETEGASTARSWVGTAEISATFLSSGPSFEGRISGLAAQEGRRAGSLYTLLYTGTEAEISDELATFDPVEGEIKITSGRGTTEGAGQVRAEVGGGFTHNGDEIAFDGFTDGRLTGNNVEVLQLTGSTAGSTTGSRLTITENGEDRAGNLYATAAR